VERVENEAYSLGKAAIILGRSVRVNVEIRDRAAPYLNQLASDCGQSIYLTCLHGDMILYIYAIESPNRLLARTAVGELVPLHCTANGKSIAALLNDNERKEIFSRSKLIEFTPYTITSPELLEKELCEVRNQGYALDRQEHEIGTYCLGAPIIDARNQVIGAISISGQDPEIIESKAQDYSMLLRSTAQEVSRRMGYVPSLPSQIIKTPIKSVPEGD